MNNAIKPGDIVRLTDPISNGQIVRIEKVDEYGMASWLGGAQKGDMEQIDLIDVNSDLIYYYHSLSELVRHIEEKTGIKLYPESAVEYWKRRAEIAEESIVKSKDYIKKVCQESSDDIQKLDAENKKLKEELSRCRAANADYLTKKTEAVKRQLDESNKKIEKKEELIEDNSPTAQIAKFRNGLTDLIKKNDCTLAIINNMGAPDTLLIEHIPSKTRESI